MFSNIVSSCICCAGSSAWNRAIGFSGVVTSAEHYRIVPGVVTLMVGLVVCGRSAIAAVSLRGSH
jgi:hypothetical protein